MGSQARDTGDERFLIEAYEEGEAAREEGESRADNPYDETRDRRMYDEWNRGYDNAF